MSDSKDIADQFGCGDAGCIFGPGVSTGMSTNGGCQCLDFVRLHQDRIRLRGGVLALRAEVARLKEHATKHVQSNAAIRDVLARADAPRKPERHPSEHITLSEAVEELAIHCEALRAALEKAEQERDEATTRLRDLLAIIHRDDGTHSETHGIAASVNDAHITWGNLVLRAARAEAERDELRLRHATDAQVAQRKTRAVGDDRAEQRHTETLVQRYHLTHGGSIDSAKERARALIAACREPVGSTAEIDRLRTALAAAVAVVERAQRAQLNIGVLSSLNALHMTYLLDAILEPDDAVRATLPGAKWLGGNRAAIVAANKESKES